ncbi:putative S-adenosyl-L-methionine-dependent methyltransferase protein [Corchorus olitorius]|uniref:Methyltransferase n=1 Tax=Corchorus olitorius TaxID=93759 RepID=A0A1R3IAK0_9ROSI|nr:putative S-adenosyl-L-methionine-dependent methyltransferase protein [Corchorus olitorius]
MAAPTQPQQQQQQQQSHPPSSNPFKRPLLRLFLVTIFCSLAYILGSYSNSSNFTLPRQQERNSPCLQLNFTTHNHVSPPLNFEPLHKLPLPQESLKNLSFCPANFTNYLPCHDPYREKRFSVFRFSHRERHCPESDEKVRCLIPRPKGYRKPFPWPQSRDLAWFKNVPFKRLAEYKKSQNWVRLEGDKLVFPGGGTSFPKGVKSYVEEINKVLPLKSGKIRTALDVGCGVASFGAFLMDYNILTLSMAPRDIHEAQVQFALERGVPAMLGILSTYRLPFPSRSFDMAHCSRCLVRWTEYDGLYLLEIDRVLRPGGYWILSGPPINWRFNYKGWERKPEDLENEQLRLEDLARRLCWKKIAERGQFAVWQKPTNHLHCTQMKKSWKSPPFCATPDPDAGWYKTMDSCITPLPNVNYIRQVSGGALEKWPQRLNVVPPRVKSRTIQGISIKSFSEDNQLWKTRVSYYGVILKSLSDNKYRNIMDMNAGLGGFASAMQKYPVWVMNTVPYDAKTNTLGIVFERGLIGTYMNWCEAFSTYPRTYDLVHANGIFSMYMDKCDFVDILLEIYRIVRPQGAVIIRDHVDVIMKLKRITDQMRWHGQVSHSEKGPFNAEKILLVDNSEAEV